MNLYILDDDPRLAALYHCDKHVVKMIPIIARMLCAIHNLYDDSITDRVYIDTYKDNLVFRWLQESEDNYEWTLELLDSLAEQYKLRFHKDCPIYLIAKDIVSVVPEANESIGITAFAQIMPIRYKQSDAVAAYRNFYISEKLHCCTWRYPASIPHWILESWSLR